MTSHPSHRPVSALRARMIEDMRVRGFSEKTRNDYIRNVRAFAVFIGRSPDTATAEDLRRFQLHQRQTGVWPPPWIAADTERRYYINVVTETFFPQLISQIRTKRAKTKKTVLRNSTNIMAETAKHSPEELQKIIRPRNL
jgi:hypothetical protein